MIQNDRWIKEMAAGKAIIEPFESSLIKDGVISFGPSSFGYDFRVSNEFMHFRPSSQTANLDPKNMSEDLFETEESDECIIPPNRFVLAKSLEYFRIPRNILGICTGKSTYSRCGILVNITPLEPEWEGHITFPIYNTAPLPARIYPGEGIAQVIFLEGLPPDTSYADRKGKYQAQKNITLSKV